MPCRDASRSSSTRKPTWLTSSASDDPWGHLSGVPGFLITSNSGYAPDLNLYQAVKGMSAAARIVKPKGIIIMAAECWDGIPNHGEFKRLLWEASSPE
ncbi:MAG: hypothetical protein ACPLPQ_11005 [Candidatus Saccharicenans sp.]